MEHNFKCPYCFKVILGNNVLFRSEKIDLRNKEDILPGAYDDIEMFEEEYEGENKEKYLKEYREWEKYHPMADPIYEEFWRKYRGTTEYDPADELFGVKAYQRPVICSYADSSPSLIGQEDVDGVEKDEEGMITQIQLISGETCNRRICPFCHNPLPMGYGKNPIRFVTLVGLAGSGKTVFLSQLLKNMSSYCAKVGLSAIENSASVRNFLKSNVVAAEMPLPGSTPYEKFQQPLFFEIVRGEKGNSRVTETLVIYDVAGEVFASGTVGNFAPFVKHADGIIVLIDPLQFEKLQEFSRNGSKDKPITALQAIYNIVSQGDSSKKCDIPFAVCISKADCDSMQTILNQKVKDLLLQDIKGIIGSDMLYKPQFNADSYKPLEIELKQFFLQNDVAMTQYMFNNYSTYSFFAFSSLGQEGEVRKDDNGEEYMVPVGNVNPRRIEEPLLWLFYKFGYIGKHGLLDGEFECPKCNSSNNHALPDGTLIMESSGKLRKLFHRNHEMIEVNRQCDDCGWQWNTYAAEDADIEECET